MGGGIRHIIITFGTCLKYAILFLFSLKVGVYACV